jgi:hypothetical protein
MLVSRAAKHFASLPNLRSEWLGLTHGYCDVVLKGFQSFDYVTLAILCRDSCMDPLLD